MNQLKMSMLAMLAVAGLMLAAALLPSPRAAAEPTLGEWASSLPTDSDRQLAAMIAVQVAAVALDVAVEAVAPDRISASGAAAAVEPPEPARRPLQTIRPMMPFYSFASAPARTRES